MIYTIKMENPPEGFAVEFWASYGFTANNKTTTNGSLACLLSSLKFPESREEVLAFAREVAKNNELARRQVAIIDNQPGWKEP